MMSLYNPFSIPIGIFEGDQDNGKLKEIIEGKNKDKDLTSNWTEDIFEWDDPEIKQLERLFKDKIQEYQIANPKTLFQFDMVGWANIRKGESWHPLHSHPKVDLICNYYIATPKGSRLEVLNPDVGAANFKWTMGKDTLHTIDVKEGMMIIMPSWYMHQIPPTFSEENRISVSANVTFKDNG